MPTLKSTLVFQSNLRLSGSMTAIGRVRDGADAADEVRVVVEDEVAEAGELAVHRDVREVHVARDLVLVERHRDARRAAVLEVEVRVAVEAAVAGAVEADREDVA